MPFFNGFYLFFIFGIPWVERKFKITGNSIKSGEKLGLKLREKLISKPKEKFPNEIKIEQFEPSDDEVIEEWNRKCEQHLRDIHGVNALKLKDNGDYPWVIYFGAGEFIREEPFFTKMNDAIYEALTSLENVNEVHAEDREKYIVSGNPSGHELVKVVSEAIDNFAKSYIDEWKEYCKQT